MMIMFLILRHLCVLASKQNYSDAFIVKKNLILACNFKCAEASNPGYTICLKKVW